MTEATTGIFARSKKSESAASWDQKIKNAQNIGDFSDQVALTGNLSLRELAGSLKFAG